MIPRCNGGPIDLLKLQRKKLPSNPSNFVEKIADIPIIYITAKNRFFFKVFIINYFFKN